MITVSGGVASTIKKTTYLYGSLDTLRTIGIPVSVSEPSKVVIDAELVTLGPVGGNEWGEILNKPGIYLEENSGSHYVKARASMLATSPPQSSIGREVSGGMVFYSLVVREFS